MRYVYTGGPYAEYRGYVFANGQPVEIKDRATLEAIGRLHDFRRYDEEPAPVEAPQPALQVVPQANSCPKCGKALKKQGAHFHIRACKGST
jgi:hypothetical protein